MKISTLGKVMIVDFVENHSKMVVNWEDILHESISQKQNIYKKNKISKRKWKEKELKDHWKQQKDNNNLHILKTALIIWWGFKRIQQISNQKNVQEDQGKKSRKGNVYSHKSQCQIKIEAKIVWEWWKDKKSRMNIKIYKRVTNLSTVKIYVCTRTAKLTLLILINLNDLIYFIMIFYN